MVTYMGHDMPSVIGDRSDLAQRGEQQSRSSKETRRPVKDLVRGSSSRQQARLRQPHVSCPAKGPTGDESNSSEDVRRSSRDVPSFTRSKNLRRSGNSCDSLIPPSSVAQPAAHPRGRRAERLAAAGGGVTLGLTDVAAEAWATANCRREDRDGDGDLGAEHASSSGLAREHRKSEPWTGARRVEVGEGDRASTGIQGHAKRRRIRGKQPPLWTAADGATTSGENSVQVACSAGPSRSAHLHFECDRRAACGDRHGQALEPCSAASDGAGRARGAAVGDGGQKWPTWRGRPPDAD